MSHTEVLFGDASHAKVLKGATLLADAVRLTLGPRSKAVLIGKKWGAPHVCDDGVTVAKQLKLKDPVEDLGAQMLKQAAERTGEAVGDGTSIKTLLPPEVRVSPRRKWSTRVSTAAATSSIPVPAG